MKQINRITAILALALSLQFVSVPEVYAQCPMCRMSAESNLKNGGTDGQGLNNGILYMLVTPYLLVGVVGYIWWRNRRREGEEDSIWTHIQARIITHFTHFTRIPSFLGVASFVCSCLCCDCAICGGVGVCVDLQLTRALVYFSAMVIFWID